MTPEQHQEVINLRARNLTPKQIARKLGLKVAEVTAIVKGQAQETALTRAAAGELDPVAECLVNANCAKEFLGIDTDLQIDDDNEMNRGMAIVSVARKGGYNRLTVCTYLLDLWCLGVKDTLGPRKLDEMDYKKLINAAYRGFPEGTREITLEQAQALVFSAVDYAAQLGLSPHPDFEKLRSHLGEWSGEPKIQCGRNGKPFYMSGPYDNPNKIIKTLRKNVGEGNFDYLMGMG